jgi:hypothetical protein
LAKTNTQKTVGKVKNLRMEEKPSFTYLCICVQAKEITALQVATSANYHGMQWIIGFA